ncbi:MAG: hypothetical protein R3E32_14130 [Chitinophagales bacterium]
MRKEKKTYLCRKIDSIKKIGNILFFIAGFFLFLHNVTPHLHHSEMSETKHNQEHQAANNLFDWLSLTFHNDMGKGHLECFSQGDNFEFQSDFQLLLWDALPLFAHLQNLLMEDAAISFNLEFQTKDNLPAPYYFSPSPLRAPPCLA